MSTKPAIKIFERITKKSKGRPFNSLKEVKNEGTEASVKIAVEELKNKKVSYFEIIGDGVKTSYSLTLSGKNYVIKARKI